MARSSPVDRLLAESERLREELLRTADRLEGFSTDLLAGVRLLQAEAASRTPDGTEDGAS
jgi:hypothetical protein